MHIASIATLCQRISPTTVPRFVVSVVVNPVNGHPVRSKPHVFNEALEAAPLVANANTTCSVVAPFMVARIGAALPHPYPRLVGGRLRHAMRGRALPRPFRQKTTTRLSIPIAKTRRENGMLIPAIASTQVDNATTFIAAVVTDDYKTTESSSRYNLARLSWFAHIEQYTEEGCYG